MNNLAGGNYRTTAWTSGLCAVELEFLQVCDLRPVT